MLAQAEEFMDSVKYKVDPIIINPTHSNAPVPAHVALTSSKDSFSPCLLLRPQQPGPLARAG